MRSPRLMRVKISRSSDRLTDRLFGGVTEDALGASVPARDNPIEVLAYDRVVAGLDDGCQHAQSLFAFVKRDFDMFAFGNVAIDLEHGIAAEYLHAAVDSHLAAIFADVMKFAGPIAVRAQLRIQFGKFNREFGLQQGMAGVADRLVMGEAVKPFGSGVPEFDRSVQTPYEHGLVGQHEQTG